jgi:DNA modification methylase
VRALHVSTSPKQPSHAQRDWYPYYAGYTESFVRDVFQRHFSAAKSVLDPWNGSGTTTAVCNKLGVYSSGIDLNPALTLVARGRLTPRAAGPSLLPLAKKILAAARKATCRLDEDDLLLRWMRKDAAARVRAVQSAIHSHLMDGHPLSDRPTVWVEMVPDLASFYYCALFATVRDLLQPFRTTNPMWLNTPNHPRHRVASSWLAISEAFLHRTSYLRDRLGLEEPATIRSCSLRTASADSLPFDDNEFDAVITSPPYATRMDYIKGTIPELAVLGLTDRELNDLRMQTMGTPVVSGYVRRHGASPYARSLIEQVANHPTKGSAHYYAPWLSKYVSSIEASIDEISRVVKTHGSIAVVVQDSYYKELRIDLQKVFIELMAMHNRPLRIRQDHPAKALLSNMHPFARRHTPKRNNTESLLVFGHRTR